jgi:3-methyladenine DNA glycosylase/8-oxoguanine DNA glycosylase
MILDEPEVYDWERLRNIPAEEAVETLDTLPGVGPWTAQYIVMRGLPHNDYFLTYGDDIKKTLVRLWSVRGPLSDADAQRLVAAWSPYRRIACYYTYMFKDEMRDMPVAFPGLEE